MAATRTEPGPGESGTSEGQPAAALGRSPQSRPGELWVAIAVATIVGAVLIWWAWKQGAYFGSVFLPGAIILYGLLIILLLGAPFNGRLSGPARVALIAISALAAWTLLSIAWTPANDAAVQNAERVMLYVAVFALGLFCCNLARNQMLLPLGAVAATGAAIAIVSTVTLAGGTDVPSIFHGDATLRFPIGYRNAEAAFLFICLWPTLAIAVEAELPWQLRALTLGAATMLLEFAVLAQSRGSLPAAAVALPVFLALSPRRLRAAIYIALAAIPVLPALPTLLDVFQHGGAGPGLVPLMRDSARAVAVSSIGSVILAAICIRGVEPRLSIGQDRVRLLSRAAAGVAVVTVLVAGTVFVAQRGGPLNFVDQRVSEFKRVGYPNFQGQGTRFGVNVGSNRHDFWRVAVDQGGDHPLIGAGAGSFAISYLQERKSPESPRDPHSVEMLMWSELGVVGLILFATFLVSGAVAGLRSVRLGSAGRALAAGSLASGAYWLVHASYDWFWNYPALTAPVMFLLGAAAAPQLPERGANLAQRRRYLAAAALAAALVVAVPLFLSQRYANRAYGEYPQSPAAALDDLDRAASLDPYDPEPLLSKGLIESRLGLDREAISTFNDAVDREPDLYASHFLLARALAASDPRAALAEAEEAMRLNPLDRQTGRLKRRLQRELGP
jgi:O-antigen ligase/polysaccharide polymerase Wzy-like membrane protein